MKPMTKFELAVQYIGVKKATLIVRLVTLGLLLIALALVASGAGHCQKKQLDDKETVCNNTDFTIAHVAQNKDLVKFHGQLFVVAFSGVLVLERILSSLLFLHCCDRKKLAEMILALFGVVGSLVMLILQGYYAAGAGYDDLRKLSFIVQSYATACAVYFLAMLLYAFDVFMTRKFVKHSFFG